MTRIRFEDLPSTNTPINADNLNKLNNVIVSSEEPTTGEEVWLEKGKNLFDKSTISRDCWINSSGGEDYSANSNDYISSYIECKANTSYTLSGYIGSETNYLVICSYDKNYQYIEHIFAERETTGTKTFVVNQDCYIRFAYGKGLSVIDNVQLEIGDVATEIEPYITKKIYTKTDNGYENFYNEENFDKNVYLTSEVRIGTYLDKPLYRKTIINRNEYTAHSIKVFDDPGNVNIKRVYGIAKAYDNQYIREGSKILLPRTEGNYWAGIDVNSDNVTLQTATVYTKITDIELTIEYTKTTD